MKLSASALSLLVALGSGPAMAVNCTPSAGYHLLNYVQMEALLNNGVACYPGGGPPWTNQEYHSGTGTASTGNIVDYKKGPGNRRDPSKQIGSYKIVGTGDGGEITYTYTGAAKTYAYKIFGATTSGSGLYDFCLNGTTDLPSKVMVKVATGGPVAC